MKKTNKLDAKETNNCSMPLKHIVYRAAINGVQTRVRSIQEFTNDAKTPVEAVYVFLLPDEASVTGCQMVIGQKKIIAAIKEREEARQEYDQAIASGHHGALMEQERPNIFTMNVGGIEPGEAIQVEIDYVQRVPWQDGGGRFRIPLVVAPRFIPGEPIGKASGGWASDTDMVPDASRITPIVAKKGVPYYAGINISFAPGFRCRMNSPSHGTFLPETTVAKNEIKEIKTGHLLTDRDFILTYRSLSKVPEATISQGKFDQELFSLISIFPSNDIANIPTDFYFLYDGSGSMDGKKMNGLKILAKKILQKLKEQNQEHKVANILFSDSPRQINGLESVSDDMLENISKMNSGGRTFLGKALSFTYTLFEDNGRPKVLCVYSDGQTDDLVFSGTGAIIICVGIDSAVNDTTLKEIAGKTGGGCAWFYPGEDFDRAANTVVGMLSGPVLKDVKVESGGEVVGISDVFNGMPLTAAVRFGDVFPEMIKVSGKNAQGRTESWDLRTGQAQECDFAAQIWAREMIRETKDKGKQIAASLKYGVICQHTSFVAIAEKEVPGEKPVRIEIPVNLPHGWNYDKIFGVDPGNRIAFGLHSTPHTLNMFDAGMTVTRGIRSTNYASRITPLPIVGNGDLIDIDLVEVFDKWPAPCHNRRFNLTAADPIDKLIGILIAIEQGKFNEAQTALDGLKLSTAAVASWKPVDKARALYFLVKLRFSGLRFDRKLIEILKNDPAMQTKEASSWYNLALKELGVPYETTMNPKDDGYEYVMWKFGGGSKPRSQPWASVQ